MTYWQAYILRTLHNLAVSPLYWGFDRSQGLSSDTLAKIIGCPELTALQAIQALCTAGSIESAPEGYRITAQGSEQTRKNA